MSVKIVVEGESGRSVRIKLSSRGSLKLVVGAGSTSLDLGLEAGLDERTVRVGPRTLADRIGASRNRVPRAKGVVSAEMVSAAVSTFLESADAARLGRSLTAVYLAMDAVRRGQARDDPDEL